MTANGFIKKKGFTLIEALIASAILGIVLVSLISSLNGCVTMLNDIRENACATAVIQEEIESLRKRFFRQLPVYGLTSFSTSSLSKLYNASGKVYIDQYTDADLVRAAVTVTWYDRLDTSRQKMKRVATLIARNGINSI